MDMDTRSWLSGWHAQATPEGLLVAGPITEGWLAVGYYVPLDGALHLADLAIVPGSIPSDGTDPQRHPGDMTRGEWFASTKYLAHARETAAIERTKQPRAVYAQLLRKVRLDAMQAYADESAKVLVEFGDKLRTVGAPAHVTAFADALRAAESDLTPAKLEYLQAAARFAGISGTLSNSKIAATLDISIDQLRDRLNAARKLGYLTSPGRGRRGGELTELGKTLAKRHLQKGSRRQ